MTNKTILFILFSIFQLNLFASKSTFNDEWYFYKGNLQEDKNINSNITEWRKIDLPHDWAIEGPFDIKYNARCGGLPFHGIGWYKKTFKAEDSWKNKIVTLEFDGAMSNAKVWLNGKEIGEHHYGYIGFEVDLTKHLKYDGQNVIAVKLSPMDLSSRWYPGAGIYRNVWLKVDNKIHVARHGVFVTTPTATGELASIQIETNINNNNASEHKVSIKHTIIANDNKTVATINRKCNIKGNASSKDLCYVNIEKPNLWDITSPYMYKLKTEVYDGDTVLDEYYTNFGIREILFTQEGFYLNGKKVRFNGVCLHHDNGPLGAELNVRADERKLEIMKEMGVNAIRTSHNPPAPEFLDLCDRMGLLVVNEAFDEWKMGKVENGYNLYFEEYSEKDLTEFIMRDRNHPSVIMWSIGNEILEQGDKNNGFIIAKRLSEICHKVDNTRPSTAGFNYYPAPFHNNIAQQIDIVGMNYHSAKYSEVLKKYPNMIVYGSETSSCTSSRGIYHLPIEKYDKHKSLQVTSYDLIGPPWACPPDMEFYFQENNPNVLGEFMWTGFDYLGEPTPYGGKDNSTNGYWNGDWPSRSSYFGAVDLCGLPKDRFYLYQSQWTTEPMVHLLPHWNWTKGMTIPVYVYTNCHEAELFLNGKSLGKRVKGKDLTEIKVSFWDYAPKTFKSKYRLSWNVPYEPGELTVKAYSKDGGLLAEKTIRTAGKPDRIRLIPDREIISADGKDLSYITVRIEDKDGNLCPNADNLVKFSVEGAGHFKAVGNGNAATTESFTEPQRKAFSGMCMLIVQSEKNKTGKIKVNAVSSKLKDATIYLSTK